MKQVLVPLDLMHSVADYVGRTQPLIEKAAQQDEALTKSAVKTVDRLVADGLLSPHLKEARLSAYRDNPHAIYDDIQKLSGQIKAAQLGGPSGEKSASVTAEEESSDDAFARIVLGGAPA